jgi:Ni/Co efflux regulator RcnB
MKRLVFALALVAVVGACKKAEQQPASTADSTKVMMSDSTHMMSDSTKMMDTTKH